MDNADRSTMAERATIGDAADVRPLRHPPSQPRLGELFGEVQDRVEQIVEGRDRLDGLVEAMLVVTSSVELDATLRLIVHSATNLVDARYGAWNCMADTTVCCKLSGIREQIAVPPPVKNA
jgi:hypothetical protein